MGMNKKNEQTITAYKGFTKNLTCTGGSTPFQYEVNKTYIHDGDVQACSSGFHSCEYPLDCFGYYAPSESVYHEVSVSGSISRETSDTKIASASITINAQLFVPEIVSRAISWITERCDPVKAVHTKKDQSASSATGYRSASSATGYRSASSATGYRSASSATGDRSASSATGDRSASSATGYQSASSATGDRSASSATGHQSASSATGDRSASSATGDRSASSATGYQSASSATGKSAVAINIGFAGKAMADDNGAIVLVNHDDDGFIRHIRASKVGENGVKKNVWYVLNDDGEFEESK